MKKIVGFVLLIAFWIGNAQEVTLGKVNIKKQSSFGMKKFKDADKKIFIQEFFVNYQMLYDQVAIANGGREAGGGVRGKAKAQLVLGVQGISTEALQKITDSLYKAYTNRLIAEGFEIVTASDMKDEAYFEDWTLLEGGKPDQAQFPGYVTTAPSGFDFYVKKVKKDGKRKNRKNVFDNGMGTSKKLGGIIIARVNIAVPFLEGAESQGSRALRKTFGGVAKVVAKTDLSITERTSLQVQGGFALKTITLNTNATFAYKQGLKNQATLTMIPKKKIQIKGVFESKKYKAVKSGSQDLWGTDYGAITVFSAPEEALQIMQAVPCDEAKYTEGVYTAATTYLKTILDEFTQYFN
jgi:hypothetical protein